MTDPANALAGIRERGYKNGATGAECARLSDAAAVDIPRLLAALSVAIGFHVEAVVAEMPEPGLSYCKTCSGHPAWPCPEVRAITTALTDVRRT